MQRDVKPEEEEEEEEMERRGNSEEKRKRRDRGTTHWTYHWAKCLEGNGKLIIYILLHLTRTLTNTSQQFFSHYTRFQFGSLRSHKGTDERDWHRIRRGKLKQEVCVTVAIVGNCVCVCVWAFASSKCHKTWLRNSSRPRTAIKDTRLQHPWNKSGSFWSMQNIHLHLLLCLPHSLTPPSSSHPLILCIDPTIANIKKCICNGVNTVN